MRANVSLLFKSCSPQPPNDNSLCTQASRKALDLLNQLLQYEPERRVTSVKVLAHPFLNKYRRPQHEPVCPSKLDFSFDDVLVGEDSSVRYRLALLRELQALQHPHMSDHDYTQLANRSGEEALKRELVRSRDGGEARPTFWVPSCVLCSAELVRQQ